jgi:hypothetical protein
VLDGSCGGVMYSWRHLDFRTSAIGRQDQAARDQKLDGIYGTVSNIALEEAANTTDALKKQTLELSSTLMSTSTEVLSLIGAHGHGGNPPPGSQLAAMAQESMRRAEARQAQGRSEAATLLSDYNNKYAGQVIAFRQQFMDRGQSNWNNVQYYAHAADFRDVQRIGFELFQHANALK